MQHMGWQKYKDLSHSFDRYLCTGETGRLLWINRVWVRSEVAAVSLGYLCFGIFIHMRAAEK